MINADHPLIDGAGDGWAATETRAEVIAFGVGMSDFLHKVAVAGARPIIVSDEYARMTQPLAEALSAVGGHWVARTADDGLYDTRTGAPLAAVQEVLDLPRLPTAHGVHPAYTRASITSRLQVVATVSTRHRTSRPLRLGGVLEAASESFAAAAPSAWGATEPLVAAWDRDDVTERSRRRMPSDSRWAAVTHGPKPVVGTLHIARTAEGVEETTRVWAGVENLQDDDAQAFLTRAAGIGMPLLGVVFAALGAPDLARRGTAVPQPEPLALLIGPPGLRALDVDPARWVVEVGGTSVGSPRLPGAVVPLGSVQGGGWQRLADVLATLDPARVATLLSVAPHVATALRRPSSED
ncbi:hypothetical protein GCM10009775_14810 [Microbacterium aoyamense]|uniref:Uncharacterized protein n=1 Tax=Microbacterium aoyamense TaxID=344166 RepID=A0ABN2PJI1_9MICO|nr:DUF6177 family protein [Microbacterium aoyamense]